MNCDLFYNHSILLIIIASTLMQVQNQKAIDNALFKKLEQLSIKMPSDPILYKSDVQKYETMFKVEFEKVQGDTMKKNERFGELLIFLARSLKFFPQKIGWIPSAIMRLLQELGPSLHSYIRKKCAGSIMILRAKNILLPVHTIQFLLKQMKLEDKELRSMIYKYVLNDLRRMNSHHQNNKINQQIRAFMSGYIPKHADKTSQKCLKLLIQLYKRNVWTDNRTVNIISQACFAPNSRIRMMACHFLMQTTMPLEQLPDSDDQPVNPSDLKARKGVVKQTKYKEKQLQKEKKRAARRLRKKEIESRNLNYMPIDVLYNPQAFAEKLFNIMGGKKQKYPHKLTYMSLVARIIWRHQLILLPFYRSLIKFLDPKQKDVHLVLAALAQSIHQLVPEDEIQTIVKHIVEHFVNDRCSQFTMTVGLNTLRQIFKKLPSIINQEMMLYLCTYYQYKNKNVSRAAKSVINFVREYNNQLLPKKFRGRERHQDDDQQEQKIDKSLHSRIPGAQLLGMNGQFPVQIDRVMTDQDFKKIKRIMKKKEQERDWGNTFDNQIQDEQIEDEQNQEEQGQEQDDSDELEEESQLQVEDDLQSQNDGQQGQDDQQQGEDDEQQLSDSQQDGESVLQWQDQQEIDEEDLQEEQNPSNVKSKTKQIKKDPKPVKQRSKQLQKTRKVSEQVNQSSSQNYQQSDSQADHGFIQMNQIAYYKMSKTELKADKKNIKQGKQKFKHKPKEKAGGSTNKQKSKMKPLMMVRAKKNKIRSNERQLKTKIKHLKNQLGKVRSGKQAKRLKNKKIIKTKKK